MDPASAFSIAAAVAQFIHFSSSLASQANRIYKSSEGAIPEQIECENASRRLRELSERLRGSMHSFGSLVCPDSKAVEEICNGCVEVSDDLQKLLCKIPVEESGERTLSRKWKSFREALRSASSVRDIHKLNTRLAGFREELGVHLLMIYREQVNALTTGQEEGFAVMQSMIQTLLDKPRFQIEDLPDEIKPLVHRNAVEHEKTWKGISAPMCREEEEAMQTRFLRSLGFPEMQDRHLEIAEAHNKTFKWIFEDSEAHAWPWSNFIDWLRHGSGVYWINGKAGSGKSTLMRYLVENSRTVANLKAWAGTANLNIGAFFFWNSGTVEQRSYTGLLRTLLYKALETRLELAPLVFPKEWEEECSKPVQLRFTERKWTLKMLLEAFNRLATFDITQLNQCYFIDGLDEYEGNHEKMAEFLQAVAISPHIKFCLSSRPYLVFEDAFQHLSGLRLQDLTYGDIKAYVADELEGNHRMRKLSEEQPKHASELVNEIVTKADGVFLWVMLVVRDLLNGLRNRDDIPDLQRRLQALPSELGALYAHTLGRVERLYQEQASRIFQIYGTILGNGTRGQVSVLELELAVTAAPHATITSPLEPMGDDEIQRRCDHLDAHLKSRCSGLLEIHDTGKSSYISPREQRVRSFLQVSYLHRTVKDFLENEDVRAEMLRHTANTEFEPNSWILMSYIMRLKCSLFYVSLSKPSTEQTEEDVWPAIDIALQFASAGEAIETRNNMALIDELDLIGRFWASRSPVRTLYHHWADFGRPPHEHCGFLSKAVSYGLLSYVSSKLEADNTILTPGNWSQSILRFAVFPNGYGRRVAVEMVKILLRYGLNPNQLWAGYTPWQIAISHIHQINWNVAGVYRMDTLRSLAEIFELLLQHGASPDTTCMTNHIIGQNCDWGELAVLRTASHRVSDVISDVFKTHLPYDEAELKLLVRNLIELRRRT